MKHRLKYRWRSIRLKGATLALIVAMILLLVIVGIASYLLIELFGAARELQALTDSGTLNIGKQMVTLGVPLNKNAQQINLQFMNYAYGLSPTNYLLTQTYVPGVPYGVPTNYDVTLSSGIEGTNFALLTDSNGNITLQNYDRVIAQTMLVGLNAQAEETVPAVSNAQMLYDAVQRTPDSLSARLLTKLSDSTAPASMFMNTGFSNSLRMLGLSAVPNFVSANYKVAYTSPNSPTNVWIDQTILPAGVTMPPAAVTNVNSPANQPYIAGYASIDTGPFTILGTPVFPAQQPHLISLRDFQSNTASPADLGYVEPNSFGATGSAASQLEAQPININSSAVVGVLGAQYPACIPSGYLVIEEGAGPGGSLPFELSPMTTANQQLVMNLLIQRIREIDPLYSVAQVQNFLNNVQCSPAFGPATYIYIYPDTNNPLYPAWHQRLLAANAPDGMPGQLFASLIPPPQMPMILPSTVPTSEMNVLGTYPDGAQQLYNGSPTETWWVNYYCDWMPSSGFNNMLGLLKIP